MKKTLKYYLAPFQIICKHKMEFLLWLVFVVIAGQMGTLINIVSRHVFGEMTISQSILADSVSGNFYTFSLVLVASLVGSYFIRLLVPTKPEHRRLIVPFVAFALVLMIFAAVFFSFQTKDYGVEYVAIVPETIKVDIWQTLFFVFSILVAVYAFGLERLHEHREYDEMAEYRKTEDERVNSLSNQHTSGTVEGGLNV